MLTADQAKHEVRKGFRHMIADNRMVVDEAADPIVIEDNGVWVPVFIWVGVKQPTETPDHIPVGRSA